MTLRQAIDQLRPELPLRDDLVCALEQLYCDDQGYFATIPKDIRNVIAEFVPILRRDCPEFDRVAFDAFFKHRIVDESRPNKLLFSAAGVLTDYPDIFDNAHIDDEDGCSYIKYINGKIVIWDDSQFYGPDAPELYKDIYVKGNPHSRLLSANVSYILPCGLLLYCHRREVYLHDLRNNSKVQIDRPPIRLEGCYYLIDDYGRFIRQNVYGVSPYVQYSESVVHNRPSEYLYKWSELTPKFLSCQFI